MKQENYITISQMTTFLKHRHFTDANSAIKAAEQYYSEIVKADSFINPFQKGIDIIMLSDDDFLKLSNGLPFLLSSRKSVNPLQFHTLVPPRYECFITRHLNDLPAMWYDSDFFEICYLWKGSCFQQMKHQTAALEAGDFLIIPPGVSHQILIRDPDSVVFNIMVKPSAFKTPYGTFLSQKNTLSIFLKHCLFEDDHRFCLKIHTGHDLLLKRIIKHFTQECYIEQTIFCDFASGILNQLFSYMILFGETESDLLGLPDNLALLSLLRDIQTEFKTITLHELAQKYHFAEETLSRLIHRMTGKTFTTLVREIRIEQACFLLANTDLPLEQISESIGYQEYSSFYRFFSKETGKSPSTYRKLSGR